MFWEEARPASRESAVHGGVHKHTETLNPWSSVSVRLGLCKYCKEHSDTSGWIGSPWTFFCKWRTLHHEPNYVFQWLLNSQEPSAHTRTTHWRKSDGNLFFFFYNSCFVFTFVSAASTDTCVLPLLSAVSVLNVNDQTSLSTVECLISLRSKEMAFAGECWIFNLHAWHREHLFSQALSCSAVQTFHRIMTWLLLYCLLHYD